MGRGLLWRHPANGYVPAGLPQGALGCPPTWLLLLSGGRWAGLGWPRLLHERCLDLGWHLGQGGALGKAIRTKDATSYGWAVLVLCGGGAHVPVSPGPPLVSARAGARTVKESIRASVRVLSGVSSLSLHVLGPIVVSARVLSGVGCPS